MYDILIIGAGITGAFLARDLSRYQLRIALLDKEDDIACGATMANSAIIHSGHDPKPGTLKARLNVRGSELYEGICRELGVAYRRTSAFVAATGEEESRTLDRLEQQAKDRRIPVLRLSREEALCKEPHLSDHVTEVLELPTTAIITPWEVAIALADEAVLNGTDLQLQREVVDIRRSDSDSCYTVTSRDPEGRLHSCQARRVIDAAGVYADRVYALVSEKQRDPATARFTIHPRKGEYYVIDREEPPLVQRVIYPAPSDKGKGVLAVPTIHHNLLIGPNSDYVEDREDVGNTGEALSYVRREIARTVKDIPFHKVIRHFSGLRPSGSTHDFIIEEASDAPGFYLAAAIESPGLTAAPAISEYIIRELLAPAMSLVPREQFLRRRPFSATRDLTPDAYNRLIRENPAYGHIICRCEQISEGEILDAIHRPAGARTIKGIRKRCRPGMGRCQGGFCEPLVTELLRRELSVSPEKLLRVPPAGSMQDDGTAAPVTPAKEICKGGEARTEESHDLVIIGGGSAGMAAAIAARQKGVQDILILERDGEPGGILLQCIHNGFGLHTFGEELCGPAYAERFADQIRTLGIRLETNALVLHLHPDKTVEYVSPTAGYVRLQARAVILAMGCRERPRGSIGTPGTRPSGIWTAGTAQRYLNLDGILPGRRIFILGSGDIGLIMARRMTLEGARVLGVAEIMPYSNGLPRNLKQCLDDFGIPLYLSHTVTDLRGKDRLEEVVIAQVDENRTPIPGTEKVFAADTLLLSVGLIPENSLSEDADIPLHPRTRGPLVDEHLQTRIPGIFACGNVLHVHDLVDFVSEEGKAAGESAADYLQHGASQGRTVQVAPADRSIGYVLPQQIHPDSLHGPVEFKFRVSSPGRQCTLRICKDGQVYKDIRKRAVIPAEMEKLVLKQEELCDIRETLTLQII